MLHIRQLYKVIKMAHKTQIEDYSGDKYKYGFTTQIQTDTAPIGLNEDIIRLISAKKQEPKWLLDWRLRAFEHWKSLKEPTWANVSYPAIDYQALSYYSAPKQKVAPKSLEEVDKKESDSVNLPTVD